MSYFSRDMVPIVWKKSSKDWFGGLGEILFSSHWICFQSRSKNSEAWFFMLRFPISIVSSESYCYLIIEPPHGKTNKMTCAPSEDSDQPWQSSMSIWINLGPLTTYWAHIEDSDQTGRIWVFAGRTCHFVGFVVRRLNVWETLRRDFFHS